jgi:trehalose 6-phosphate synthase/phosphatase
MALSIGTPIHYLRQSVSPQQLIALYRRADVMLVTPVRDGMNLVAKEFAASRTGGDGVLVLSEFAGAAEAFASAVLVNPRSTEQVAAAMCTALDVEAPERRRRMKALQASVRIGDIHW